MAPGDFFAHRVTLLRGAAARWNDLAREINGFNPLPVRLGKSAVRALPGGDALTRLPLAYSFDDHSPNHYISNMAPNGTLRTRARIR
jgi:hypothetical protein